MLASIFIYEDGFTCFAFELKLVEHINLESGLRTGLESILAHWTHLTMTLLNTVSTEYLLTERAHCQLFDNTVADWTTELICVLLR